MISPPIGGSLAGSTQDEQRLALFIDFENIAIGVRDAHYRKFDVNLVLERLLEKEETSPDAQIEYQQRNLMAFAATEEVPYDSSGRILMPPMMRRKGQIGELALFLGTGETFQIWNPQLLLDDKRIPEDLKDIARFRLEERGLS